MSPISGGRVVLFTRRCLAPRRIGTVDLVRHAVLSLFLWPIRPNLDPNLNPNSGRKPLASTLSLSLSLALNPFRSAVPFGGQSTW